MSLPKTELDLASVIIDHPIQPGWVQNGLEVVRVDKNAPVPEPFERFGRDAKKVMHALNVASRRTDSARAAHEQQNVTKLLLTPEEYQQYLQLAGQPAEALRYMQWLGLRASEAFTQMSYMPNIEGYAQWLNRGRKVGKIGLELFAERQRGEWNTQVVDGLARKVPEILKTHAGAEIEVYDDPEHPRLLGHYFIPLYHRPGERGAQFNFGTVRRRRMLADIVLNGVKIELFKESTGVLVLQHVPEEIRQQITGAYVDLDRRVKSDKRDSVSARAAGGVFTEAIGHKDTTLAVVPMSIQDIMMVRAPGTLMSQIQEELKRREESKAFD